MNTDQNQILIDVSDLRPTAELEALFAEPESRPRVCTQLTSDEHDPAPTSSDTSHDLSYPDLVFHIRRPDATASLDFSGIHAQDSDTVLNTLYMMRRHFNKDPKPIPLSGADVKRLLELVASDASSDTCQLAIRVVFRVAEHQTALAVESGVCPVLLDALAYDDPVVANIALGCLLAVVSRSPANCNRLVAGGIVDAFVKFAERDLPVDSLRTVPLCVQKICTAYRSVPEQSNALRTFLPVINKLLLQDSDTVLADVCSTLMSFVRLVDRAGARQWARADILCQLVRILGRSDAFDVIKPILHVLHTVVSLGDQSVVQEVLNYKPLTAFRRLLSQKRFSPHVSTVLDIVSGLVSDWAHIEAVFDAGLLPKILNCFRGGNAEAAVAAMHNLLCGVTKTQFEWLVEQEDPLRQVLDLIVVHTNGRTSVVKLTALKVVWGFLRFEESRKQSRTFWQFVESHGAMDCLDKLQSDNSEDVRFRAVRLIFEYWQTTLKYQHRVAKASPKIEVLVEGIRSENRTYVLDHLVMLRLLAAKHSQPLDDFIHAGGVERLVELLQAPADLKLVHLESIRILGTILAGTVTQKLYLATTAAYKTLFNHIRHSSDTAIVSCAAQTLLTMTSGGTELHDVTHKDLVLTLTDLVDRCVEISDASLECVAGCLNNLFCYRSHPVEVDVVHACLPALQQLLMQDSTRPIVLSASWALENVTYTLRKYEMQDIAQICATIDNLGILDRLLDLVQLSEDADLTDSVLRTLARYSYHHPEKLDCQKTLSSVLGQLSEARQNGNDAAIMWIVANLTRVSDERVSMAIKMDLFPTFVQYLGSSDVEVQQKAVLALYNMLSTGAGGGVQAEMIAYAQEHAIKQLIDIATMSSDNNLTVAAVTVLRLVIQLSREFNLSEDLVRLLRAEDVVGRMQKLQCNEAEVVTAAGRQLIQEYWALAAGYGRPG